MLREMTDEDFPALKAVIGDKENMAFYSVEPNDAYVTRWLNWCKDCYQRYGFGLWAVVNKETGEMIGDCGVSMQPIGDGMKPEIGYHLRKDCHRKGFASEAAQAVKDYFFTHFDFDEVYSYMTKDNVASYKTAEKNGMKFLYIFADKHGEECRVYRITRKEWEQEGKR